MPHQLQDAALEILPRLIQSSALPHNQAMFDGIVEESHRQSHQGHAVASNSKPEYDEHQRSRLRRRDHLTA